MVQNRYLKRSEFKISLNLFNFEIHSSGDTAVSAVVKLYAVISGTILLSIHTYCLRQQLNLALQTDQERLDFQNTMKWTCRDGCKSHEVQAD